MVAPVRTDPLDGPHAVARPPLHREPLVRPEPPRSAREQLAHLGASLSPARLAVGSGTVLLLAVTSWWLLRAPAPPVEGALPMARPAATTAPAAPAAPTAPTATAPAAGSTTSATVVVQAAGAVVVPGVHRLPAGARVVDLLAAAGGASPDADLDALTLAAPLVDGQRVWVPRRGDVPPGATVAPGVPTPSTAGSTIPAPLDLNTATADELDTLPGVGPATAARIIAHRERNGPFRSVDDLLAVSGLGPAKVDALRGLVRV